MIPAHVEASLHPTPGASPPAARRGNDKKLFFAVLAVALLLFAARALLFRGSGRRVLISQNGVIIHEYSLDQNRIERIPAPDGGSNTLCIQDGMVWVREASCPDKICERAGKISLPGEIIACLPNRLIIQISE